MADPYLRYAADRASGPPPTYAGYIPSEPSTLPSTLSSQPLWTSHNHLSSSSDYLQNDILPSRPRPYGVDDYMGSRRPETGISRYAAGTSRNGHPPVWEDPYPLGRRDVMQGIRPEIPDIVNERPASLRMADGPPVGVRESNVLFVDALPSDCSRREVSHLFRPFLGFQELRLVHKEPRHGADRGLVLCFVEFSDSKHALTALEALQGYKFDNKKPDSPALKIQFAHFPFQLPPDREEQRHANSFQLPSNREDQGRLTPRRMELMKLRKHLVQSIASNDSSSENLQPHVTIILLFLILLGVFWLLVPPYLPLLDSFLQAINLGSFDLNSQKATKQRT